VPVFARHAHRVGKHRERVGLGQIGDRIEAASLQQLVDQRVGLLRKALAQSAHD
jgi:hypothetical protein